MTDRVGARPPTAAGIATALALASAVAFCQELGGPVTLGPRRELFVNQALIEKLEGAAQLRLHAPTPQGIAITHDAPWEGNTSAYHTVFRDGPICRLYYRASHFPDSAPTVKEAHPEFVCYAESPDGVRWTKPDLGLIEFKGSKQNNIVWNGPGTHNFAPFRDTRPGCPPEEQYKALALGEGGLLAFASAEGLRWRLLTDKPVITKGAFDSQNLAFWDPVRECYVDYHRASVDGVRAIMTSTSSDFRTWTDPVALTYPEGTPTEHLYTNQILAYPRAPQFKVGFPKRFLPERRALGNRMSGLSDGVFMSSRDGQFFRRWPEAFIRPGPQRERWVNRNNLTAWGLLETESALAGCPPELSLYSTEGYYEGDACRLRRFTLRLDGFVSVQAPMAGGGLQTRPFTFALAAPGTAAPAAAEVVTGPLVLETERALRGATSLRFLDAAVVRLPSTQELGKAFTLAITLRSVPAGHRRLFSAYDGGAIKPGDRELILDLASGDLKGYDWGLRFMYDGLVVSVPPTALPEWGSLAADKACQVAATWDDGVVCLYVNGRPVAQGGAAGGGAVRLRLGDLHLGEDYPPTSLLNEPLLGVVDDILVLRRALSAVEVERLAGTGPDFLTAAGEAGVLYTVEGDRLGLLTDRLTADGVADADFETQGGPEPGACQLLLNCATSAAGSLRVEVQDPDGKALPGLTLDACDLIYGDAIERVVSWQRRTELKELAGTPVRLRFELRDADLYALRFGRPEVRPHP
jgi:hypothetical protein